MADILDRHFGNADAPPSDLADAFHDVDVPVHRNEHIVAVVLRTDQQRVQHTGRWLVRHSTDRCSALVGLALLATDRAEEDIPLIQTIGLLSNEFGLLAADALNRRRGGEEALLWLAQRTARWGKVYVIEALCRQATHVSRHWLLRHACDGNFLNGYFAGKVATAAHLHDAITGTDIDDDLIDHTGRLLGIMADCDGMGMTLGHYPPAAAVLTAHTTHLARQTPTVNRYLEAAIVADHLARKVPDQYGCTTEQRDRILRQYLAVLNRSDWCDTIRADLDRDTEYSAWFAANVAVRLRLRAFTDATDRDC